MKNTLLDFKQLFSTLKTAYIVFDAQDPDCTIIEQNHAHAEMAMVNREDVIGKKLLDAFPDTSDYFLKTGKSHLVESIRSVAKSGKTDVMPVFGYDIKDRSGKFTKKFWEVSHIPLYDGKTVVAVVQQSKDITDTVLASEKLLETQQQLEQALTHSEVGTWIWDVVNDVVIADKNTARLFSLSSSGKTFKGPIENFTKSIHPDDVERVDKEIKQALKTGKPYESEYRTYDSDKSIHWLLARGKVEKNEQGEAVRFPGLVVDITERKLAERRLHVLAEANTQLPASFGYRQTLDAIASKLVPDVADWCAIDVLENGKIEQVTVTHKDPSKVAWARQIRREFGPTDSNAPNGVPWVIRTGKVEHVREITDDMLKMATKNKQQLNLLREVGMASVIIAPLVIDKKTIGAITFISTDPHRLYGNNDVEIAKGLANRAALAVYNATLFQEAKNEISEREKLQLELEALNASLETKVKQRTEQLEATNDGLEKEIKRRKKVEAELEEYSLNLARSNQELQDFAYVASHDLQEPLRKIRAFGDILLAEYSEPLGDGKEYLERMQNSASRMSTLIQDLLAFSRVSTREQVTERIDIGKTVRDVLVDLEWQIERLNGTVNIGELPVINADATHMRQLFQNLIGNALKFHRPEVPPVVSVELCESQDPTMYTICVKDNGIGFDERYLDRIFSVFQRLHGKGEYEGTGIGLAVVRKIVERYGGTITATSKKNVGSTFKMSFPKTPKESI